MLLGPSACLETRLGTRLRLTAFPRGTWSLGGLYRECGAVSRRKGRILPPQKRRFSDRAAGVTGFTVYYTVLPRGDWTGRGNAVS